MKRFFALIHRLLSPDRGWRIKLTPSGRGRHRIGWAWSLLGLPALLGIVWGLVLFDRTDQPAYLAITVGGGVGGLLAHFVIRWGTKRHWVYVLAVCLDREVHRSMNDRTWVWDFRVTCRFEMHGADYTVTPFYGRCSWGKERLEAFLEKTIEPDGTCLLRVNPDNPLEADFVGRNPTEFSRLTGGL